MSLESTPTTTPPPLSHPIPSHVWVAADGDKCLQLVPMYWLVTPLLLKKTVHGVCCTEGLPVLLVSITSAPPRGHQTKFIIFETSLFLCPLAAQAGPRFMPLSERRLKSFGPLIETWTKNTAAAVAAPLLLLHAGLEFSDYGLSSSAGTPFWSIVLCVNLPSSPSYSLFLCMY